MLHITAVPDATFLMNLSNGVHWLHLQENNGEDFSHDQAYCAPISHVSANQLCTAKTLWTAGPFVAANLTKADMSQLVPELEQLAYDIPDSWSTELRAMRVDLGVNPGLLLQGTNLLCGGTGNCQIFVFRRVHGKWMSLFEDQAPICERVTFGAGH